MKYARIFNIVIVLSLIYVLAAFSPPAKAAADATISIQPPTIETASGKVFGARINISDVTNFHACNYDIVFNSMQLQIQNVFAGKINGQTINIDMQGPVPGDQNRYRIVQNMGGKDGVSGSGDLATIQFRAVAAGTAYISLQNVVLSQVAGQQAKEITADQDGAKVQISPGSTNTGGGGGGGGIALGDKTNTNLASITNSHYELYQDVEARSFDHKAVLYLKKGTIVKNSLGSLLVGIQIETLITPPDEPPDSDMICCAYDIRPNGATFDPPAQFTFKYDPDKIPEGVLEGNLYVALWNATTNQWEKIGGTVDPVAHTITVSLSHLSTYTVMIDTSPADLELSDLTVSPAEAVAGGDVTVSALVTNAGDLAGDARVALKIDGNVTGQTQTVSLAGHETQTVSFSFKLDTPGEHNISLNNLSTTCLVKTAVTTPPATTTTIGRVASAPSPASFTVSALTIDPAEVRSGGKVNISTSVTNVGGSQGSCEVVLKINNILEDTKKVDLKPDASQIVNFSINKVLEGDYTVDINGSAGEFSVTVPNSSLPGGAVNTSNINWPLYAGLLLAGLIIVGISVSFINSRRRRS